MRLKKEFGGSGTAAALARHAATRHQARRRGQDITHVAAIRRTEDETLGARCVTQRRPDGDDPWAQPAAEQSGLESPRRTRGRSPGQPIKDSRHLWAAPSTSAVSVPESSSGSVYATPSVAAPDVSILAASVGPAISTEPLLSAMVIWGDRLVMVCPVYAAVTV
jgi:hypothetical protein